MDDEIASLYKNKTWELVKKPVNRRVVGCKWIYKVKECLTQAEPRRFKARLVAKGILRGNELTLRRYYLQWLDMLQ